MTTPAHAERMLSVDVYRGLVMLLLLPDLTGGFSLHRVAENYPDSGWLQTLATQFQHVQWSGMALWDFIEPSFVFLVGVALSLSYARRSREHQTRQDFLAHGYIRCVALFLLALLLKMPLESHLDELWPLALLTIGFALPERVAQFVGVTSVTLRHQMENIYKLLLLGLAAWWLSTNISRLGAYDFAHVFSSIALASIFVLPLIGKSQRVQMSAVALVLVGSWALFAAYPTANAHSDLVRVGVQPTDQFFDGFFAHWNKNTNIGWAFDVWLMNALPRAVPFEFHGMGLTTLGFVPLIATILFGVMAGEFLQRNEDRARVRNRLLTAGAAVLAAGLLAGEFLCPIVKMIWTPSWALVSGGLALLTLGTLHHVCEVKRIRSWALPLSILGTNSILLYVLASTFRWRVLEVPRAIFGADALDAGFGPLLQAFFFLAFVWIVAALLYRQRWLIRL